MPQGSGQSRIVFGRDFEVDTETTYLSSISRALNVLFDILQYKPAFMRALRIKRTCSS